MMIFLTLLAVFAAVFLILAVLVQPGKADMVSGMGGFGGQMTNLFGVRTGRNLLANITMGLAIVVALLAIVINKFFVETEMATKAPITTGAQVPTNMASPAPTPAAQPTTQQPPAQQTQPAK